jgi:hypothetical protein
MTVDPIKLRNLCREIARKLTPPRERVDNGNGTYSVVGREFTAKENKILAAHTALWYEQMLDAFGVRDEE